MVEKIKNPNKDKEGGADKGRRTFVLKTGQLAIGSAGLLSGVPLGVVGTNLASRFLESERKSPLNFTKLSKLLSRMPAVELRGALIGLDAEISARLKRIGDTSSRDDKDQGLSQETHAVTKDIILLEMRQLLEIQIIADMMRKHLSASGAVPPPENPADSKET
ncbi:MAG: hypothetical protein Q7S75_02670 [bacterium]|nr:hypothetical protein [bacterium]